MADELEFASSHPFVKRYLDYVANTETPRIMHIWAALSGVSACMGRRCWLPFGTGNIWPNMYIVLTGAPALRKSTAFTIMAKLLRANTSVRFAPDDTGGARQGLIAAMAKINGKTDNDDDAEIIARLEDVSNRQAHNPSSVTLDDLSHTLAELGTLNLDTRDPYSMFIAASELNSVLGEGNTQLLTFLQKMYDGDPYKYQLKTTTHELKEALLGIIGATTPDQIALALPPEAVGQGFTSRAIFVYADKKHARRIARPSLDPKAEMEIGGIYSTVYNQFEGAFTEDPVAANHMDELYERGIVISDPRFVYYAERRHTHLQKVAMALAASRCEMTIRDVDVNFADQLLLYTEAGMPDALGEYGMSKLSAAKQKLLDYLRSTDDPIPVNALYGFMSRDMSQIDFKHTLSELHNAKKITITTLPVIGQCVMAISDNAARTARKTLGGIERLLANGK